MQSSECSECRVQRVPISSEQVVRVQSRSQRVQSSEFRVQSSEFRVQRVQSSEFKVRTLGSTRIGGMPQITKTINEFETLRPSSTGETFSLLKIEIGLVTGMGWWGG